MSSRAVIVVAAAVAIALVLAGAAAILLSRDSDASATGDHIAYGCKEQNSAWYAICVVRVDGTDAKRLTHGIATTDPSWSPEGDQLAFTRHDVGGEFAQSSQDDIFVMDADGSDIHQITPERVGQSSFRPTWAPDGERIAFLRSSAVAINSTTRYGDLFVVNVDNGDATRLTRGKFVSGPAWSPDGRAIAMAMGTPGEGVPTVVNSDIYVLNMAGGSLKRLTDTHATYESAPAWSPDGSQIAFARWTFQTAYDGKGAIYVVKPDGSEERLVLSPRHFANGPYSLSWSPDGRSLAFETSSMLGCTSISAVDLQTNGVGVATTCSRPVEATISPSWQPAATSSTP